MSTRYSMILAGALCAMGGLMTSCADESSSGTPMPVQDAPRDAAPAPMDATVLMDLSPDPMDTTPVPDVTALPMDGGQGADATLDIDASPLSDMEVVADMGTPSTTATECFEDIANPEQPGPDYDQFDPVVGTHCSGTNHQDIQGVERVIFLGDSVSNGTPNDAHPVCLDNDHFFRVRLANWLSERFDLSKGDPLEWEQWEAYSCLYDGLAGLRTSGDFWNCARWGARLDDFMGRIQTNGVPEEERANFCADCCAGGVCDEGNRCIRSAASPDLDARCGRPDKALFECVPDAVVNERTLFAMTIGGNDVAAITKRGGEFTMDTEEGRAEIEAGYPTVRAMVTEALLYLEEAVRFMKDPARFPNGSYVVMGGPFEFTDGTGRVGACQPESIEIPFVGELDLSDLAIDVAALVGFEDWANPDAQRAIISEFLEGYMRIMVEYEVDYVWVLEHFCGHGYVAAGREPDMSNHCYRPEDPTLWFDASCTHPNDAGHAALFRLFKDVIEE